MVPPLIKFTFSYILKFKKLYRVLLFTGMVAGLASVADLFVLRYFFNELLKSKDQSKLWISFSIFSTITLSQAIMVYYYNKIQAKLEIEVLNSIRKEFFYKILSSPFKSIQQSTTGALFNQLKSESKNICEIIKLCSLLYRNIHFFSALMISALIVNWRLGICGLIWGGVVTCTMKILSKGGVAKSIKVQSKLQEVNDHFINTLRDSRIIRIFNLKSFVQKNFNATNQNLLSSEKEIIKERESRIFFSQFLFLFGILFFVFLDFYFFSKGSRAFGDLIATVIALKLLIYPLVQIFQSIYKLKEYEGNTYNLRETLKIKNRPENRKKSKSEKINKIEFSNVSFKYKKSGKNIIDRISFSVSIDDVVLIKGQNGAGKSTLLNLIAGLLKPTSGSVKINGKDICWYNIEEIMKEVSIVAQETALFNDSIYNNIAFAKKNVNKSEVESAAILATADEFIKKLPKGYETEIGENGSLLSQGQRQRISIARAFLRNSSVLLLDEPMSAIDRDSKKELLDSLNRLISNRIVFLISHDSDLVINKTKVIKIVSKGHIQKTIDKKGFINGNLT